MTIVFTWPQVVFLVAVWLFIEPAVRAFWSALRVDLRAQREQGKTVLAADGTPIGVTKGKGK
jgi:hypothetical protein